MDKYPSLSPTLRGTIVLLHTTQAEYLVNQKIILLLKIYRQMVRGKQFLIVESSVSLSCRQIKLLETLV